MIFLYLRRGTVVLLLLLTLLTRSIIRRRLRCFFLFALVASSSRRSFGPWETNSTRTHTKKATCEETCIYARLLN